jgi:WD40 repeat protein
MNNAKHSPQRNREYALYRYRKALERGDFETISAILLQAEQDVVLDQMIAELSSAEDESLEISQSRRQNVEVKSSSNGQPPKLDLIQEEKTMTPQIGYWQRTKSVSRRSNPFATAVMTLVAAIVLAGILLSIRPSRQFLLSVFVQPTPTPQMGEIITADNLDWLTQLVTIPKEGAPHSKVNFSPDSRYIVFEDNQQQIRLWNIATQKTESTFNPPYLSAQGRYLVFSPDGKQLAANGDGSITIWNLETGASLEITTPLQRWFPGTTMAFSQDGSVIYRLLCGHGWDELPCDRVDLYGWDTASGQSKINQMYPMGEHTSGALLPAAHTWAQSDGNGQLVLRDLASGLTSRIFQYKGSSISLVGGSSDGSVVVVVDSEPSLKYFNANTGSMMASSPLDAQQAKMRLMAFSPDNNLLATIGAPGDEAVEFWNVKDGKWLSKLDATDKNNMFWVIFSPDGRLLMTDSNDGNIRIWGIAPIPKM